MAKQRILLQLDTDPQPSVFDSIVATDSGVDLLLRHGGVDEQNVTAFVHGAIFTRSVDDLRSTAIFLGGSNVDKSITVLKKLQEAFFGPMRVSVLFDPNGANTTAAAAVLTAVKHHGLRGVAVVLGATGPVGQRAARLLQRSGYEVRVASRSMQKAEALAQALQAVAALQEPAFVPVEVSSDEQLLTALEGAEVLVSAGAAGVCLVSNQVLEKSRQLKVAIDLNAVPPVGIEAIKPQDNGALHHGVCCFGALSVGGLKMKIHKAAILKLFESNSLVLDAEEVFELGQALVKP